MAAMEARTATTELSAGDALPNTTEQPLAISGASTQFLVNLDVYQGPFDALLTMLARRSLDVTEVSLSAVTQEFIDFVKHLDMDEGLESASAFIDVASILIEAKSAALLPHTQSRESDEQTMQALKERDLLFARLLQYKAFKQAGNDFRERFAANSGFFAHQAVVTEQTASMLPQLQWTTDALTLARLAAQALVNAPPEEVSLAQLHVPQVDLQAQAGIVRGILTEKTGEEYSFDEVIAGATSRLEMVARFLAVLIFFKQGVVQYKQSGPFAPLALRWVAGNSDSVVVSMNSGDFV